MLRALLDVPSPIILGLVFLLPALEASTLIGVLIPGETVILLGGVLAWYGHVPLASVMVAAALGAILGDSVGYWVGFRWGKRIVEGRVGRVIGEQRWARARLRLKRKGLMTIVLGRFPPFARTLVPLLAGSARMPYHRFLIGNAVGGIVWASASVLAGYFAGDAWQRVQHVQHIVGAALLAAIVLAVVVVRLRGRRRGARHPRHA
jgi:membrane-associated protein